MWPWGLGLITVWSASGLVILLRPVEDAIMKGREGLRAPTDIEDRRLKESWGAVTRSAGVDPGDYRLWIQKSRRINAYATAGHTVAVTEAAVARLSPTQLEAVLAHELGHHLGGHAWASLLRYWYSLPAMFLFQFATGLTLALTSALRTGSSVMIIAIGVVVIGVLGYLCMAIPVVGIAATVVVVAQFGMLWVERTQEYEADAIAARLGYRTVLAQLFRARVPSGVRTRPSWQRRIGESHPSDIERAVRLECFGDSVAEPAPQGSLD